MEKLYVSSKLIVHGENGKATIEESVTLTDGGHISVAGDVTELTIGELINEKEWDVEENWYTERNDFDILVAGEHSEAAKEAGGGNQYSEHVKITVENLVGDVLIKAVGVNGRDGANGKDSTNDTDATNGENGTDGGNCAIVEFTYRKADPNGIGSGNFHSAKGGRGGRGGNGGKSVQYGNGGTQGMRGSEGGKHGNGGSGGKNGKDGLIIIKYNDGGSTENKCEQTEDISTDRNELDSAGDMPTITERVVDFTNPKDLRVFIQKHGGAHVLKKFPKIWDGIMRARNGLDSNPDAQIEVRFGEMALVKSDELDSLDGGDPTAYYNLSGKIATPYISKSDTVPDCVYGDNGLDSSTPVPAFHMVDISVVDVGEQEIVYSDSFCGEGNMQSLEEYLSEGKPYEHLVNRALEVTADVTYFDSCGNVLGSSEFTKKENMITGNSNTRFVKQILLKAPHWKEGKTSGEVVFLYGRTGTELEPYKNWDYKDGHYLQNTRVGDTLRTIIPINGKICFQPVQNLTVKEAGVGSYVCGTKHLKRTFLDYFLGDDNHAVVAEHRTDIKLEDLGQALEKNKCVILDTNAQFATFNFKLPLPQGNKGTCEEDWNYNLNNVFLTGVGNKCYLYGVLPLELKVGNASTSDQTKTYNISIESINKLPKGHDKYFETRPDGSTLTVYLPPILIYWGCYARETLITLTDGTTKRADEIRVGDRLPSFGGKDLTVCDILRGDDPEIYKIVTECGNSIRVSCGHAMKVHCDSNPQGRKVIAAKLVKGDVLMTPTGNVTVASVTAEEYNDTVYNFVFEGEDAPNYIIANGFWSGDMYAQNKAEPRMLSAEEKEFAREFKEFAKLLNIKMNSAD